MVSIERVPAVAGGKGAHRVTRVHARHRPAVVAMAAAVGGLTVYAVALLVGARHASYISSDTDHLIAGTRVALSCLDHHVWTRCAYPDNTAPFAHPGRASTVRQFALLQYLPTALMVKAGLSDRHVIAGLMTISSISMAVTVAGPLAFYAVSGFGEMFATLMVTLAIAAAVARRPVALAAAMAVACIGKETFAPFLIVLAIIAARRVTDGLLPPARVVRAAVAGAVAGVAVDGAFNIFRFGTPLNRTYLDPQFVVPGIRLKANFSLAMWVSPNAGLLWFWPLAVVLLGAVVVLTFVVALRRRLPLRCWLPVLATCIVMGAFTWGLGSFVAPFGWVAWGPRLLLPLVPAVILTAVVAAPRSAIGAIGRGLRTKAGIALFSVLLAGTAVTQVGAVWTFVAAYTRMSVPDAVCPTPGVIVQEHPALYYRCLAHMAWRSDQLVLPAAGRAKAPGSHVAVVALLVGGIGLAVLARRSMPTGATAAGPDPTADGPAGPVAGGLSAIGAAPGT